VREEQIDGPAIISEEIDIPEIGFAIGEEDS